MATLRVDIASEFTGAAAFKKAGKASSGLEKGIKSLGKSMGLALSATAIASFGKAAVKAFMEDEKAAASLANTLKNLGVQFAVAANEDFIANLEKTTNVADDQLRPALAKLITQTGSLTYAQDLLANAIEISRGSGVDLETVASDLSAAYVGNMKGLKKYATGLTNAELAGMSFEQIMVRLNGQFSGSSAAYLETYAGKMDALTVAGNNAKETIGKGLLDAINIIAGEGTNSLTTVTDGIAKLAEGIGNYFRGVATFVRKIWDNPIFKAIMKAAWWFISKMPAIQLIKKVSQVGADGAPKETKPKMTDAQKLLLAEQKRAAEAQAKLIRGQKIAAAKAKKDAEAEARLKKASLLFDMEHIQRIAALKGQLSEDDRNRVLLQLALLDGNMDEAKKLTRQVAMSIDETGRLATYLNTLPDAKNPFLGWKGFLDDIELQAKRVAAFTPAAPAAAVVVTPAPALPNTQYNAGTYVPSSGYVPPTNVAPINRSGGTGTGQGGSIFDNYTPPPIVIEIDGKAIAYALQTQSMSGNNTSVDRTNGSFAW
jgi:hypothetical protein